MKDELFGFHRLTSQIFGNRLRLPIKAPHASGVTKICTPYPSRAVQHIDADREIENGFPLIGYKQAPKEIEGKIRALHCAAVRERP